MLNFTQMMWKKSASVGLGVYSKYVVAWFCPKGNDPPTSPQDYVENINDVCRVPEDKAAGEMQYDRCYNEAAVTFHNQKRALHKDTPFLELDPKIAKWIQDKMDNFVDFDTSFAGRIADKGAFYNCGENVFQQQIPGQVAQLRFTDAASKAWYGGSANYNENTGESTQPGNDQATLEAFMFTKMVWKKTKRVGFGVRGKWVIAWYCESQPASNSPGPVFVRNVGKKCIDQEGVQTCYNKMA
jgi:hypothetical protein